MTTLLDHMLADPAALLPRLETEKIEQLQHEQTSAALEELRKLSCQVEAMKIRLLARFDQTRGRAPDTADDIGRRLRIPKRAAERQLNLARKMTRRLPNLLDAMSNGQLDQRRAEQAVTATSALSDDLAREADAELVDRITSNKAENWRKAVVRTVCKKDPSAVRRQVRTPPNGRRVVLTYHEREMMSLQAFLPTETARTAYERIDSLARSSLSEKESRTIDELRADVLCEALLGRTTVEDSSSVSGDSPDIAASPNPLEPAAVAAEQPLSPAPDSASMLVARTSYHLRPFSPDHATSRPVATVDMTLDLSGSPRRSAYASATIPPPATAQPDMPREPLLGRQPEVRPDEPVQDPSTVDVA